MARRTQRLYGQKNAELLRRKFEAKGKAMETETERVLLKDVASIVIESSRRRIHKVSGALGASLAARVEENTKTGIRRVIVGTDMFYARWVEYGGTFTISRGVGEGWTYVRTKAGTRKKKIVSRFGQKVTISPHPFLSEGFQDAKAQAMPLIVAALRRGLRAE